MSSSLRLLLEDFLSLMREEGELDVFLPLLLSAMGHEIVYRAQKGTRQYGVDISSVGKDDDGKKKLFLWLVKCGDIGRRDWNSGDQSIRPSIDDVGDTYLSSHVAPQHAKLPKKLVVLTNGDFNAAINLTIAQYLATWTDRHGVEALTVNGSTLAAWTERYLLDEHVLPAENRALLRRMLANVGTPELSITVGRTLIQDLVNAATEPATSAPAKRKRQLASLRGIRTSLSVLQAWAHNERNLLAPYRLSEFAVLCVWAGLHEDVLAGSRDVAREFAELLLQMAAIAETYHERMQPYYVTQNAFAHVLPDSLIVTDTVFSELGRLGLQGCIWACHAVQGGGLLAEGLAGVYVNRVLALLKSHSCSESPCFDYHSGDVHSAMLLLLIGGRLVEAREWLGNLVGRLVQVARVPKHWPVTAPFEDLLAIRRGYEAPSPEFRSTTTLVPILLLWAAALGMSDVYAYARRELLPEIKDSTLNCWSADNGFDALVASPADLAAHGVGEGVMHVPEEMTEFLLNMVTALPGVEPIEEAAWYKQGAAYIPLLAALHWHLQVPRAMLARQAVAVADVSWFEQVAA
jgi:hypothetical protein